jgi:hypothetical protein
VLIAGATVLIPAALTENSRGRHRPAMFGPGAIPGLFAMTGFPVRVPKGR